MRKSMKMTKPMEISIGFAIFMDFRIFHKRPGTFFFSSLSIKYYRKRPGTLACYEIVAPTRTRSRPTTDGVAPLLELGPAADGVGLRLDAAVHAVQP